MEVLSGITGTPFRSFWGRDVFKLLVTERESFLYDLLSEAFHLRLSL